MCLLRAYHSGIFPRSLNSHGTSNVVMKGYFRNREATEEVFSGG